MNGAGPGLGGAVEGIIAAVCLHSSPPSSSGAARRASVLQAIGGNDARRSDMTTKRLAELDERDHQLEQRMAELRDELAAVQREVVPAAAIQRAVALFDPVWDLLLIPERFRILHLLLESVGYDGSTGELELAFYPLGITSLAAEAATIGQ